MTRFHSETLAETHHAARGLRPADGRKSSPLKKLMTGLTAAAVAVSLLAASAVPSRADQRGDDLAKALAAALILGAIVNGIDNNNAPKPTPHPTPKPKPTKQPRVPGICAIEIDSTERGDHRGDRNRDRNRTVTVYSERCLRSEGFNYRLPNCARDIRIYGKRDRIYSEQCLRDAGFRLDRR